jgi:uncharacterized protein
MNPRQCSITEIQGRLAPLFKDKGLRLVLLFGSQASGEVHTESDIDLGFLYDEPVDLLDLTNIIIQLLHRDRVDVVDLQRAGPLLCFSAARQGILLYERSPGQFHSFYSLSFRRYIDTKKLRDARTKVIQSFLEEKR